jgi:hypothetical protein
LGKEYRSLSSSLCNLTYIFCIHFKIPIGMFVKLR